MVIIWADSVGGSLAYWYKTGGEGSTPSRPIIFGGLAQVVVARKSEKLEARGSTPGASTI